MLVLVTPRLPQIHSVPLKFSQIISVSVEFGQSLETHLLLIRLKSLSESLNLIHIRPLSYKFTKTHSGFHADSASLAQILSDSLRLMQIHSASLKLIQIRKDLFRLTQTELIYPETKRETDNS